MPDSDKAELLKLIRNEIDLGFTFAETARLAGSVSHREQAVLNVASAHAAAFKFMGRLAPDEIPPGWQEQLGQLGDLLESLRSTA